MLTLVSSGQSAPLTEAAKLFTGHSMDGLNIDKVMIPNDKTYKPDPHVTFTRLDDSESVLLHLENKTYYSLNETGTEIWDGVTNGRSIADISKHMSELYEIEPEVARSYILEFLEDLRQDGLVVRIDDREAS